MALVPCTAAPAGCQQRLGPLQQVLSDAVGGHCIDCALELGLFKDETPYAVNQEAYLGGNRRAVLATPLPAHLRMKVSA